MRASTSPAEARGRAGGGTGAATGTEAAKASDATVG
jgi:hypothetical protein